MNIVVVGAGAIGKERIKALERLNETIIAVIDPNATLSQLADFPCYYTLKDYFEDIENNKNPDWIFICTPHDLSCDFVKECIDYGYKVLVEKPLCRDLTEFNKLCISEYDRVQVGLNYRFMAGVRELLKDVKEQIFGDLISVNMILGLGDAPDTDKTWRLDPERAGRSALLDPGIHLIDLAMLISNNTLFKLSQAESKKFWNTGFITEHHVLAMGGNSTIFNIQTSKVRWRNTFRIEVNGTDGYGVIEGRGRNYGTQTYRVGKRWGWQSGVSQKESEILVLETDCEDSFYEETKAVLYGCEGLQPATHIDNKRCLEFML